MHRQAERINPTRFFVANTLVFTSKIHLFLDKTKAANLLLLAGLRLNLQQFHFILLLVANPLQNMTD